MHAYSQLAFVCIIATAICSRFLSLFYFDFLLKASHYALFYSFHAYDFTSFTGKLLNTFSYNATHKIFLHTPQYRYYAVSWSLIFTASSTVPEVGMSLSSYFSHLNFFLPILLLLPCMIGDLNQKTLQARRNMLRLIMFYEIFITMVEFLNRNLSSLIF